MDLFEAIAVNKDNVPSVAASYARKNGVNPRSGLHHVLTLMDESKLYRLPRGGVPALFSEALEHKFYDACGISANDKLTWAELQIIQQVKPRELRRVKQVRFNQFGGLNTGLTVQSLCEPYANPLIC